MVSVSIHQPNFLPFIGFFQKMALSDVFVILDTVQYSHDSYTQRTRIRTKDGWMWLTIPINKKYKFHQIKDILLPDYIKWRKKHTLSLISHYSKCPFFDERFILEYYSESSNLKTLQQFNEYGIFYLKEKFKINTKILKASELKIGETFNSTDLLIEIVKKICGEVYISGSGGAKYLDESQFKKASIELQYFNFKPFEYHQRWEKFEPYMSAIDFLFNCGGDAL
jgi:hypothetical protein